MRRLDTEEIRKEGFEIVEITTNCRVIRPINMQYVEDGDLRTIVDWNYDVEDDKSDFEGGEVVYGLKQHGRFFDPKYIECSLEDIFDFLENYFIKKEESKFEELDIEKLKEDGYKICRISQIQKNSLVEKEITMAKKTKKEVKCQNHEIKISEDFKFLDFDSLYVIKKDDNYIGFCNTLGEVFDFFGENYLKEI